jgi:hypothetical protein
VTERLGNGLTREETVRLHNEPNWGGLPPCECPICRPDLHQHQSEGDD